MIGTNFPCFPVRVYMVQICAYILVIRGYENYISFHLGSNTSSFLYKQLKANSKSHLQDTEMISPQHHDDCGLHHRGHRCSHLGACRGGDQLLTTMTHSAPTVHFMQLLCNLCTHILLMCTNYKTKYRKTYIWHNQLIAIYHEMDVRTMRTFVQCCSYSQNL